jgi:hypothetical protein
VAEASHIANDRTPQTGEDTRLTGWTRRLRGSPDPNTMNTAFPHNSPTILRTDFVR